MQVQNRNSGAVTEIRRQAFGQDHDTSLVDRFGIWLSRRSIERHVSSFAAVSVIDVGCGFDARFARSVRDQVGSLTLCDVDLAPDLLSDPGIDTRTGPFETSAPALADAAYDVVMCMSVLEHFDDDATALGHLRRITRPGGVAIINVPSWRGKVVLELSAFRLGLSPAAEMNDHKRYYDPRDLWPLLVSAGFRPQDIRCRRHKFGLNTLAVCRVPEGEQDHELR